MNNVILIGRLTREPECGATSSHRPTEEYAIDKWNSRVEVEYE